MNEKTSIDLSCFGSLGEAINYASKGGLSAKERYLALDACSTVTEQVAHTLDALSIASGAPDCDKVAIQEALGLLSSITRINSEIMMRISIQKPE